MNSKLRNAIPATVVSIIAILFPSCREDAPPPSNSHRSSTPLSSATAEDAVSEEDPKYFRLGDIVRLPQDQLKERVLLIDTNIATIDDIYALVLMDFANTDFATTNSYHKRQFKSRLDRVLKFHFLREPPANEFERKRATQSAYANIAEQISKLGSVKDFEIRAELSRKGEYDFDNGWFHVTPLTYLPRPDDSQFHPFIGSTRPKLWIRSGSHYKWYGIDKAGLDFQMHIDETNAEKLLTALNNSGQNTIFLTLAGTISRPISGTNPAFVISSQLAGVGDQTFPFQMLESRLHQLNPILAADIESRYHPLYQSGFSKSSVESVISAIVDE